MTLTLYPRLKSPVLPRWLLAVLLLCLTLPVSGQPTTPADNLISLQKLELLSVQVFRSTFALTPSAAAFERVALSVTQPDWSGSGQVLEVNLAALASVTDSYTEFTHLWQVDPLNPPLLFRDLTFTWTFVLRDGDSRVVSETVRYADPRTDWTFDPNPDGRLALAVPRGSLDTTSLYAPLNEIYTLLNASTGRDARFGVVLFDQALASPCRDGVLTASDGLEVPCNPQVIRQVYSANNLTPLQLSSISYNETLTASTRALFDALYDQLWAGVTVPAWFRFGLREFYTPGIKSTYQLTSQAAVRVSGALREPALQAIPADDDPRRAIWQAQSYGMVLVLAEQLGLPRLFQLAREISPDVTLASLIQRETGQPISTLIQAWSNWVFTSAATGAYQYHPYLPTTPTPVPTVTRTPTLTFTPSLTPSVTGELSPTPSATPTATLTPTDTLTPTLTVTPRPPGSLNTATPLPVVAITPESPATAQANEPLATLLIVALIALSVLAVVLLVIALRPAKGQTK